MKPKNDFWHAFIDIAKIGRINWQSIVLTYLLVQSLVLLSSTTGVIAVIQLGASDHQPFHLTDAEKTITFPLMEAVGYLFGLWLACKKILNRPFRSLISTDMTFDARRILRGAALYLVANAISFAAISLFVSLRYRGWLIAARHFEWPHDHGLILESMVKLFVIPVLAFAEELWFRAWLTQSLGQYIRSTMVVVVLVGLLFAQSHSQYDLRSKTLIFVDSLGFSVLSLRDQRIELAVGAHSMMNVCAMLTLLFLTGPLPSGHIPETGLDFIVLVILKGALPFALMYGILQKASAWFAPNDGQKIYLDEARAALSAKS